MCSLYRWSRLSGILLLEIIVVAAHRLATYSFRPEKIGISTSHWVSRILQSVMVHVQIGSSTIDKDQTPAELRHTLP